MGRRVTIATFGQRCPRGPRRPGQLLEQRQLGGPVALPCPVELEVLLGDAGEDRRVVGDPADAVEGEPVRVVSTTATLLPAAAITRSVACSRGASGVVACSGLSSWTPPIRVATVLRGPGDRAGGSSAATARNEVVVLPSVPVMPTTPSAARIAIPPRCGSGEGRLRRRDHDLRHINVERTLDEQRGRPAPRGGISEVVAVDMGARDRDEQPVLGDASRVVGDAADRDPGQGRRSDRLAFEACAVGAALGGQSVDEIAEPLRLGVLRGSEPVPRWWSSASRI